MLWLLASFHLPFSLWGFLMAEPRWRPGQHTPQWATSQEYKGRTKKKKKYPEGPTGKCTTTMCKVFYRFESNIHKNNENQNRSWAWRLESNYGSKVKKLLGKLQYSSLAEKAVYLGGGSNEATKVRAWKSLDSNSSRLDFCSEGNGKWNGSGQRVIWSKLHIRNNTLIEIWWVDWRATARPGVLIKGRPQGIPNVPGQTGRSLYKHSVLWEMVYSFHMIFQWSPWPLIPL